MFFTDIRGAHAVIAGRANTAEGIRVLPGSRLRIHLTRPAPDLLGRLAMPFACALRTNAAYDPDGVEAPVVGSGPYDLAEWTQRRTIRLERNRFYAGPRPHSLRAVEYAIGGSVEDAIRARRPR